MPDDYSIPPAKTLAGISRIINTILTTIADGTVSIDQAEACVDWFFNLPKDERDEVCQSLQAEEEPVVALASAGKKLRLSPLNGLKRIWRASVFSDIDLEFKRFNQKGNPTFTTEVVVYEVLQPTTLSALLDSLHHDTERLCLTQHQVLNFVSMYRLWLQKDGDATYFLFKTISSYRVMNIRIIGEDYIKAYFVPFDGNIPWHVNERSRIVVPKVDK